MEQGHGILRREQKGEMGGCWERRKSKIGGLEGGDYRVRDNGDGKGKIN